MSDAKLFPEPLFASGRSPYEGINWTKHDAKIISPSGEIVFEQKNVEFPDFWTQQSIDIVASKYFAGELNTPSREFSLKQLINRVVKTIGDWGLTHEYFADKEETQRFKYDLAWLVVHQYGAFNSPVWFNIGATGHKQIGSACQPYSAQILTELGIMEIGNIVKNNKVGLKVFDNNGLTKIVATMENGNKDVYRIYLQDGYHFDATTDHVVCASKTRGAKKRQWIPVSELNTDMFMEVHPRCETFVHTEDPNLISKAALAAWLQADGFAGQYNKGTNRSLTVEFITNGKAEFDWIKTHFDQVFPDYHYNLISVETMKNNGDLKRLKCYGERYREFVEEYSLLNRRHNIRVPERIMVGSNEEIIAYLKSFFQAEGSVSKNLKGGHGARAATISKKWMEDIQLLLLRLGIYSRITEKTDKRPDRCNTYEIYILKLPEKIKFREKVGFIDPRKSEKLNMSIQASGRPSPDIKYSRIVSIEKIENAPVYDIQTESGTYLSGGILIHNCYINSIEDSLEGIMDAVKTEAMIFKNGSGSGINVSSLRSQHESLSGGGKSSGPISFMKVLDTGAGAIRSGGKTRRSAKMVIMDADHPDIVDFIECKGKEEAKAKTLIAAGYDDSFMGDAYQTVAFQNANHSVRVSDEFMQAALDNKTYWTKKRTDGEKFKELNAHDILYKMAEEAWKCGDPGIQYDDTINKWHTCKNTDRIYGSNPCVTGDTLVSTKSGLIRIDELVDTEPIVYGLDNKLHQTSCVFYTGIKPIYEITTKAGYKIKVTSDHKIVTTNGDIEAKKLSENDKIVLGKIIFGRKHLNVDIAEMIGLMVGDGCIVGRDSLLTMNKYEERKIVEKVARTIDKFPGGTNCKPAIVRDTISSVMVKTGKKSIHQLLSRYAILNQKSENKNLTQNVFELSKKPIAAIIRGIFTADGTVGKENKGRQYISLDSTSEKLLETIQLLLLGFGIKAKIYKNRKLPGKQLLPDSNRNLKYYNTKAMHSLRIAKQGRKIFEAKIGFMPESPKFQKLKTLNEERGCYTEEMIDAFSSIKYLGEEKVYDLTEPTTHHFVGNGLKISNCSEHLMLDETACNLASLNLTRFVKLNDFDHVDLTNAVKIFITAMEIIADLGEYPTEKIAKRTREFRPLGLGFTDLGAMLMLQGIPYDNDKARNIAASIVSLITSVGYVQSAKIAKIVGPFAGYATNKKPMLEIIEMHKNAAEKISSEDFTSETLKLSKKHWETALEMGHEFGFRNSQISNQAPVGTISFLLGCTTTGIEPELGLVKHKKMADGGIITIPNLLIESTLKKLGYDEQYIQAILKHLETTGTIEKCAALKPEHISIFDCSFKPVNGVRYLSPMAHLKMLAATQPLYSSGISKTINCPENSTIEDIMNIYIDGWQMGLKCVAVYRDNSKGTQPLNVGKIAAKPQKERRRLPDERKSLTRKFSLNGIEWYATCGLYEDGTMGEIFINVAKEGSTLSGVLDNQAATFSLALQYGVPLEVLIRKLANCSYEPRGFTGDSRIGFAKSIIDYTVKWLAITFCNEEFQDEIGIRKNETQMPMLSNNKSVEHGPPCNICGNLTIRSGTCHTCLSCGTTTSCG